MRIVLPSLIVAASLAGVAYAQTTEPSQAAAQTPATPGQTAASTPPPSTATSSTTPPATTAPATAPSATTPPPAAGTPAAAGPATTPSTTAAPTGSPATAPAGQAPAANPPTLPGAEQAPPPAPTLPTTGPGAEAISILQNVCVPSVQGGKFDQIVKSQKFRLDRRNQYWTKALDGDRHHLVIVFDPGSNKNVCDVEFHYGKGDDEEILKALNVWAFIHQPPLDPTANYTQPVDPDGKKRVRRSWEYLTQHHSTGLNFSTVRKPDDTWLNNDYDTGTMQYQERDF